MFLDTKVASFHEYTFPKFCKDVLTFWSNYYSFFSLSNLMSQHLCLNNSIKVKNTGIFITVQEPATEVLTPFLTKSLTT